MSTMIKDGTGQGFLAKISSNNRLWTRAVTIPIQASKTGAGQTFIIGSDRFTIPATKGLMGWIYNTDDSKYIAIPEINISWNGGSTNHNRIIEVDFSGADGAPTTNTKVKVPVNSKGSDPQALPATVLQWDGVGTGMTGHDVSKHVDFSLAQFAQGYSSASSQGSFMLAPKTSLSLYMRGEEVGIGAFAIWAYILDPSIEELE